MATLLTGGTGFLGKVIVKHKNIGLTKTLGRSEADYCVDLANEIPQLEEIEMVVHCAGKAHSVPKTEAEGQEFFNVNVKGTENLLKGLEHAATLPKSFVFISSVSVYGAENGINIGESCPLNAFEPYGKSKIQAERLVEKWCKENNVICSILRLPLIVGDNPPGNLGAMIKGIQKGYYFNIAGGEARKSMVMADDVAKIIPRLAEVGGTYNLTDGYHPNFRELSNLISKQVGRKAVLNMPKSVASGLAKIGDIISQFPLNSSKLDKITSDLTFSDDKARANLGWSPKRVLDAFII